MTITLEQAQERLAAHDQQHVLKFWNELSEGSQAQLLSQIEAIDLDLISTLVQGKDESHDFGAMAKRAEMPPAVAQDGSGASWSIEEARKAGEDALRNGKVATIVVAGGQGTRLGFDQPKGMFPVGPLSNRTLFQVFADILNAVGKRYGNPIPWYVMVSEATKDATTQYFEENDYLGLDPKHVRIFLQGIMPAVDAESGRLILSAKDSLAIGPDGHGGTLAALDRTGALQAMIDGGVEHLFYFQVDNPLITLCDPVFIGHHILSKSEMTTQVIRKRYPTEKVGNVVQVDGRTRIIEYSDLPDEAAEMTLADGSLKLWAGNIAVHLFDLDFLSRAKSQASALPFHRAHKKVPFVDDQGVGVKPEAPNATKFERFIFDLLPSAERTLIYEVEPGDAFAPVKNADGAATDTPELARAAMVDQHRRMIQDAGGTVADGAKVEINPIFALDSHELSKQLGKNASVATDRYFAG